jgi:carboxyl-terminal processing protease
MDSETEMDTVASDSLINRPIHFTQNGRKVYGGGGIRPDHKVEFTSISQYPKVTRQFLQKRVFFELASELVLNNPSWSKDFRKFKQTFNTNPAIYNMLKKIAYSKDVKFKNSEIINDKTYLDNRIKAEIARNIWGMSRYYEVILEFDNQFQTALKYFDEALELASLNR